MQERNAQNSKNKIGSKTIYVLDTNVLINDPDVIVKFKNAEIIIPQTVLLELDKVKTSRSDVDLRFRGREVSRKLYEYTKLGKLSNGIKLENNSSLKVLVPEPTGEVPVAIKTKSADDQILALAYHLQNRNGREVVLVTSDINMLVKAQAIGLSVLRHEGKESNNFLSTIKSKRWQKKIAGISAGLAVGLLVLFLTLPNLMSRVESRNVKTPMQIFHEQQQSYINALKRNPRNFEAIAGLGKLYFSVNMWNEAVRYYSQALQIKPSNSIIRIDLAIALFNAGNRDAGMNEIKKVIIADPKNAMAHFNLAAMLSQVRKTEFYKKAISEYSVYLQLDPGGKYVNEAKTNISRLKLLLGNSAVKS